MTINRPADAVAVGLLAASPETVPESSLAGQSIGSSRARAGNPFKGSSSCFVVGDHELGD